MRACVRALDPVSHVLASRQVGEIEEQLTSARRELARSEEANQKLQRDVKEVRLADLWTNRKQSARRPCLSQCHRVYFAHTRINTEQFAMVTKSFAYLAAMTATVHTHTRVCTLLYPVAMATVPSVELQAFSCGCSPVNQWWLIERRFGAFFGLNVSSQTFSTCFPPRCSLTFPRSLPSYLPSSPPHLSNLCNSTSGCVLKTVNNNG